MQIFEKYRIYTHLNKQIAFQLAKQLFGWMKSNRQLIKGTQKKEKKLFSIIINLRYQVT